MSNKLKPNDVVARLNGLVQDRAAWENGTYKASNGELYGLLDRCFTLLEQMKGDRSLVAELNGLLVEKQITFNKGTSLATKIARFVFNGDSKRITGYAKVLRVALAEKREHESFAKFITRKGGVEEVRKQVAEGTVSRADKTASNITIAEGYYLSSAALVQNIACAAPEVHPSGDNQHYFTAALVRKDDDGTLSIVYGCNKDSVVKMLLSEGGKVAAEKRKEMVEADLLREAQAARAAAVDDLAA